MMLHDFLVEKGVRDDIEIIYTYPKTAQMMTDGLFMQGPTSGVLPSIFDSIMLNIKHHLL